MRDNFSKSVALGLAKRAGVRCSNPNCGSPTIGAAPGNQGVINIGVAAHITAASPKGPRYDETITPEERSGAANGIWLCQTCAKLIDADPIHFDSKLLRSWKDLGEKASFLALTGQRSPFETLLGHVSGFLSRSSYYARNLSPRLGSVLNLSGTRKADVSNRRESVGDLVQWGRLLDGIYAPRPDLLARVTQEYLTWIATTGEVIQNRHLPVFWIDGRSGDGKSVLLLQLAASILLSRPDILIYQLGQPDNLPDLIDYAHGSQADDGLILIVAEDLHRVIDDEAFNTALKFTLNRDRFRFAVLACGPTPEKNAFARANSAIDVFAWTMPTLSSVDLSIFSDWFETRIEPTSSLERTILVELLFASQIGQPLTAFAKTFGQRLQTFGIFETVCRIAAINALNIGAPGVLFQSTAERDSIERLTQEDQLHFEWQEEEWGPGIRLIHGIIAWKLFEEWSADHLREPSSVLRLARTLSSVLRMSNLPKRFGVQLMARLRQRLGTLLQCPDSELATRKQQLFDELISGTLDNCAASCLVLGALLAEYIANDKTGINTDYINAAMHIVADTSAPATNRALIAAQLAVLEAKARITAAGYKVAAEALVLDSVVGANAIDAVEILVAQAGSPSALMESWLNAFPGAEVSCAFLCAALSRIGATPVLAKACQNWVRANWHRERGVEPLAILTRMNNDTATMDLAKSWVIEHADSESVPSILTVLLRKNSGDESIRQLVTNWVEKHTSKSQALDVMSILLQVPSGQLRSAIRILAFKLIRNHWDRASVANILPPALRVFRNDKELINLSIEWLQSQWSRPESGSIVSALLKVDRSDEQITNVAMSWIKSRPESGAGADVLSSLLKTRWPTKSVRTAAIAWIQDHSDTIAVFNPISTLLRLGGNDEEVRQLAFNWVTEHPESPGAHSVLSSLVKAENKDIRAQEIALAWARAHLSKSLTSQLLSTLLRASPITSDARKVALSWINTHEYTVEAGQLISTLLSVTNGDPEIETLAMNWVLKNMHRRTDQHQVIAALIGTSNLKNKWIDFSVKILGPPRAERESPYVFEALAIAAPFSPDVRNILVPYLENPHNGVKQRQRVLEAWITSGGPDSPAIDTLISLRGTKTDLYSEDGKQMFGIIARASARTWETMLQAVAARPFDSRHLCYLVGMGIPSVALNMEVFIFSLGKWPQENICYIWEGVLQSKCATEHFISPLCEWLCANWRKRGYRVVLNGIIARMKIDPTFALQLPREVYADLPVSTGSKL